MIPRPLRREVDCTDTACRRTNEVLGMSVECSTVRVASKVRASARRSKRLYGSKCRLSNGRIRSKMNQCDSTAPYTCGESDRWLHVLGKKGAELTEGNQAGPARAARAAWLPPRRALGRRQFMRAGASRLCDLAVYPVLGLVFGGGDTTDGIESEAATRSATALRPRLPAPSNHDSTRPALTRYR